jgi:hypothetical protein
MSHCLKALCVVLLGCAWLPLYGTTWYVRTDGGTRYSENITKGQCNGKADKVYPGKGVDQPCAFKDVRMLWQDGSYTYGTKFPSWGWVIAGGDTVIIRGSIGTGVSYRIGSQNNGAPWCTASDNSSGCWGVAGDSFGSGAPPPPSGTAAQHTRILGENYGSCSGQSARTQLHGGWGVNPVINLKGSSYVDLACLEITDFSNCGRDTDSISCETNGRVISDFAGSGIALNNKSTYISLTDIRIHGLASDGIFGAPGTGFTANDLDLIGNADAGWNADAGDGTTGVGTLNVTNFNISWNGCVEEYPIVDPLPYFSCTDQDHGGYGDGFGTTTKDSNPPGWQVRFDHGIVSYNTQDGLDALHIGGQGSSMTVTHTRAFGNMGQQIKVGGTAATITDSLIVGNCRAMSGAIPGAPAGYNSHLDLFCRAGDTAAVIEVPPAQPAIFQRNTIYSDNLVALEVEYPGEPSASAAVRYDDNVFIGFRNSNGQYPSPIYSNTDLRMFTNPGASFSHNVTYHAKSNWKCPATSLHETDGSCGDPHLKDETWHSYGYGDDTRSKADSLNKATDTSVVQSEPSPPVTEISYSSVALKLLGGAALVTGIWIGLRNLRGRATKL